jgi:FkbM family methyltransferase
VGETNPCGNLDDRAGPPVRPRERPWTRTRSGHLAFYAMSQPVSTGERARHATGARDVICVLCAPSCRPDRLYSSARMVTPPTRLHRGIELSRLAADPVSRVWLAGAVELLGLKQRLAPELRIPVRVAAGHRGRWFWFSDGSELIALEEIFLQGEYEAAAQGRPMTIVDLGANCGQAALFFRTRFPDARILSVEADPRTFLTLQRNHGRDPLVTLRQVAITAEEGWCRLAREPASSWGTRVAEGAGAEVDHVPAVSLETLLDQHGIEEVDLLKVDIEGMEHAALATSPALRRVKRVVGEIHASLIGVPVEQAIADFKRNGGFDRADLQGDIFLLERDAA